MESLALKGKSSEIELFQSWDKKALVILKIILASCFIGICAQIEIPLYFTPVPITIQTSAIMLVGAMLGKRQGTAAVICYLMEGSLGFPVLAGGGAGFVHFIGPTGGYLFAYILQAYLIGKFFEGQRYLKLTQITAMLLFSICVQMGIGSLWLAQFVGFENCFMQGFYPFVLGEVARALLVAVLLNGIYTLTPKLNTKQ